MTDIMFWIYAGVTAIAAILMFLVVILGGDLDMDLDADADLAFEGAGLSPFSLPMIALFFTGFGSTGTILTYLDALHPIWTAVLSVITGFVIAAIGFVIILNVFVKTQSNTQVKRDQLPGKIAEVSIRITPDTPGQIMVVTEARGRVNFTAVADEEIPTGGSVRIVEQVGDSFRVEKA